MRVLRQWLGLLLAGILLAGCSTRAWYDGMQTGQAANCSQAPNDDERQRCLQRSNNMGYDNYQQERHGFGRPSLKTAPAETSAGQP